MGKGKKKGTSKTALKQKLLEKKESEIPPEPTDADLPIPPPPADEAPLPDGVDDDGTSSVATTDFAESVATTIQTKGSKKKGTKQKIEVIKSTDGFQALHNSGVELSKSGHSIMAVSSPKEDLEASMSKPTPMQSSQAKFMNTSRISLNGDDHALEASSSKPGFEASSSQLNGTSHMGLLAGNADNHRKGSEYHSMDHIKVSKDKAAGGKEDYMEKLRSRTKPCCFSCLTCYGRIDYNNLQHRQYVGACVGLVIGLIIYIIIAVIGMVLAVNSTVQLGHFELFASGTCGSNFPFSATVYVNK
jgi:hypothetical protein